VKEFIAIVAALLTYDAIKWTWAAMGRIEDKYRQARRAHELAMGRSGVECSISGLPIEECRKLYPKSHAI